MTDTTRRHALATAGLTLLGASFASSAKAAESGPSASGSHLNVRDFGTKGDGVADDTSAFQKTLEAAGHARGGIVFVPTGNYLIKGHLVVPDNVTLEGVFRAPTARSQYRGSTLLPVEGRGADGEPFMYLRQMGVTGRRPPSKRCGASRERKARSETPSGDAVDESLPEADDRLGQMYDQALGVFRHASARLQHHIAEASEIPAAAQRIFQFVAQHVAQVEGQETQQKRGLVFAELGVRQLSPQSLN